jgi:parallel beta-helix repeat protein
MENESNGILLKADTFLVLKESDIFGNGQNGIELTEESRAEIVGNIIQDNQEAGLIYRDTSGGIAQDNQVLNNQWGIYIEAGANPQMLNNLTVGNREVDFVDKR